jgi:hypothetical protein
MATGIRSLFDYLKPLQEAVAQIADTWRPDDPEYQADVYRQIMMQLSSSYFTFMHADEEHPDWAPLWNPVFTLQPNPEDIYLYCPTSSRYSYRITGNRGTVKILTFTTALSSAGMPWENDFVGTYYNDIDDGDLQIDGQGNFELLLSAEQPFGHQANWLKIAHGARVLMTRYRSYDWEHEIDPVMSIECLDATGPKRRLTPEEILERIDHMAWLPARSQKLFFGMQNDLRSKVGVNVFDPVKYTGSFIRQFYLPAVYEFGDDEALILETELPEIRRYWNFQLNDPYFNATEYVYRLSSTNGHFAKVSSDGRFRAVISLQDPGVPNWLDPAGFKKGTIYGRWYDCDSCPTPILKRVKFREVRNHLPDDTPQVSTEARAEELRRRVWACQRRRRC